MENWLYWAYGLEMTMLVAWLIVSNRRLDKLENVANTIANFIDNISIEYVDEEKGDK